MNTETQAFPATASAPVARAKAKFGAVTKRYPQSRLVNGFISKILPPEVLV